MQAREDKLWDAAVAFVRAQDTFMLACKQHGVMSEEANHAYRDLQRIDREYRKLAQKMRDLIAGALE